jgi:hypothetical protein
MHTQKFVYLDLPLLLTNLLPTSLLTFLLPDCLFHLLVFLLRTPPAYLPPTHQSTAHLPAHFLLPDCLFHLLVCLLHTPPAYLPPTHQSTAHLPAHFPIAGLLIPPARLSPAYTSCLPAPYSPTYCSLPCSLSSFSISSCLLILLLFPPVY